MSTPKTKFLVVGHGVQEEELLPMSINGGTIECVKEFPYLGSLIAASGRIDAEVDIPYSGFISRQKKIANSWH